MLSGVPVHTLLAMPSNLPVSAGSSGWLTCATRLPPHVLSLHCTMYRIAKGMFMMVASAVPEWMEAGRYCFFAAAAKLAKATQAVPSTRTKALLAHEWIRLPRRLRSPKLLLSLSVASAAGTQVLTDSEHKGVLPFRQGRHRSLFSTEISL